MEAAVPNGASGRGDPLMESIPRACEFIDKLTQLEFAGLLDLDYLEAIFRSWERIDTDAAWTALSWFEVGYRANIGGGYEW